MVKVKITQLDARRLAAAREVLGDIATGDLFRYVPTADFRKRALEYLVSITPRGEHSSRRRARGAAGDQRVDQAMADQWRMRRSSAGNRMFFVIWSLLETVGGERGRRKLESVERGNTDQYIKAKRTFSFLDDGWTRIAKNQMVHRPARKGLNLTGRAKTYIEQVLFPEMRERAKAKLKTKIEKYSAGKLLPEE